jgi:hypothetical protein
MVKKCPNCDTTLVKAPVKSCCNKTLWECLLCKDFGSPFYLQCLFIEAELGSLADQILNNHKKLEMF